jgi:taurine dioxygenase
VIYDNRCTIHSATWFDGDAVDRVMWRTTVRGNPGPEYAAEAPSWLPAA